MRAYSIRCRAQKSMSLRTMWTRARSGGVLVTLARQRDERDSSGYCFIGACHTTVVQRSCAITEHADNCFLYVILRQRRRQLTLRCRCPFMLNHYSRLVAACSLWVENCVSAYMCVYVTINVLLNNTPFYDFCCFRYVSHCIEPLTCV